MATPYFQLRQVEVPSTQDVARERLDDLPVVAIAAAQTRGRGRIGAGWENAERALAVSVAFHADVLDQRPFSLMAGVAAVRCIAAGTSLKWPNDVMDAGGRSKVGGILTERSDRDVVVGLGLNLYWPDPPDGAAAIFPEDPGREFHAHVGAMWAAEMMAMIDSPGWPREEYLAMCSTVGRAITWEPDGFGEAIDVSENGELIVRQDGVVSTISSGAVRHVRS